MSPPVFHSQDVIHILLCLEFVFPNVNKKEHIDNHFLVLFIDSSSKEGFQFNRTSTALTETSP